MISDKSIHNFTSRQDWRNWLNANHADSKEAWLVIQKKDSPGPGIYLDEAVEEALCYGWIDSTLNTIDDLSYLLRFSPRKPNSIWAITNIRKIRQLKEEGRLHPAGLAAVQVGKESGQWQAAIDRENPEYVPPELKAALEQDPEARYAYQALSESQRKRYVYWLQSAKKKETKQKRVSEILRALRKIEATKPKPFEFYTTPQFWNDPHISKSMLKHHLDPDTDAASYRMEFIERAVQWIDDQFNISGKKVCDFGCGPGLGLFRSL